MILYIDENMPKHLAAGFHLLQYPECLKSGREIEVKYLPDVYGEGAKDVDWIPELGKQGACIITQDINITRRRDELDLYQKNNIGIFILRGQNKKNGLSVMQMVESLSKNWKQICEIMFTEKKPFAYTFNTIGKMKKLK